jgi:hypothetical protein
VGGLDLLGRHIATDDGARVRIRRMFEAMRAACASSASISAARSGASRRSLAAAMAACFPFMVAISTGPREPL